MRQSSSPPRPESLARVLGAVGVLLAGSARAEVDLSQRAELDAVLAIALEHNPEVLEARERVGATAERARAAGKLPDLEVQGQVWAAPLERPWALGEAEMLMVGVRQMLPPLGVLGARSRAASAEVEILQETLRARERDVAAQVRRAFYDYYRADQQRRIRLEHVELTRRIVELARVNYQAGRGGQQDVLRTHVELSRLSTDLARDEQAVRSATALLNALMGRPPAAPLGPPAEIELRELEPRLAELERQLDERRPELVAARRAVERGQANLDAARRAAALPSLMLGLDYGYMPAQPSAHGEAPRSPHAYTAMVGVNLPWLSSRRRDEVREAERTLAAEQRMLESVRSSALFQLHDAAARYEAARKSYETLDREILPQARRSLEATQASFSAGTDTAVSLLDALRSYLQVRIERSHALSALESSLADLERAVGSELSSGAGARS